MHAWTTLSAPVARGKAGTIFEVTAAAYGDKIFIKKLFTPQKSMKNFVREVDYHRRAAELCIAPPLMDFHVGDKKNGPFIVMERRATTLLKLIKKQRGLFAHQLGQIKLLYEKLDTLNIQHNDANLANVVVHYTSTSTPIFNLIDYGMATTGKGNIASFRLLKTRIQREIKAITDTPSK